MIIDNKSIENHGRVPEPVMEMAIAADKHGRAFSQWTNSLFVSYKDNKQDSLKGWMISDSLDRKIHNSIFYSVNNKKFYVKNIKDSLYYDYKNQSLCINHAKEFFMFDITENLIKKLPSKINFK